MQNTFVQIKGHVTAQISKDLIQVYLYGNKIKGKDVNSMAIYEYNNSLEMEEDAKTISISRYGATIIGNRMVESRDELHFFKSGTIIVYYMGRNKEVIGTIEKILGKQFTGD